MCGKSSGIAARFGNDPYVIGIDKSDLIFVDSWLSEQSSFISIGWIDETEKNDYK
jgi:hypothetical protein